MYQNMIFIDILIYPIVPKAILSKSIFFLCFEFSLGDTVLTKSDHELIPTDIHQAVNKHPCQRVPLVVLI